MLRRFPGLTVTLVTLFALGSFLPVRGQESKEKPAQQPVTLKVHMPHKGAKLVIEGQETRQSGILRQFISPPLDPGRNYTYTLIAKWEPNNYTKITRTRKVPVQAGKEIEIDMKEQDPGVKDDIVIRYVPTPQDIVDEMCKLGAVGPEDVIYEPGCGDGRMIITAVGKFKAKRGLGIDLDPKRIEESLANAKKAGVEDKIEFRKGDILKIDDKEIAQASVVLLYLGNEMDLAIRPQLLRALKPGSRIISHRFTMGDWKPTKSLDLKGQDGDDYKVHLWVVGESK